MHAGGLQSPHASARQRANFPAAVVHNRSANDPTFRDPESCDINRYPPALSGSKPHPYSGRTRFAPPWLSTPWRICPGSSQTHTARLRPVTMSATRAWISPTTATGRAPPSSGVGVQSVLPGRVAAALPDTYPFGNMVIIETRYEELSPELLQRMPVSPGESLYSLYAHLQAAPLVALNDPVLACQQIGAVGTSGNSVEPHLHFETRLGPPGATFASMRFYKANATQEEREYYTLWSTSGIFRTFDPMALLALQN